MNRLDPNRKQDEGSGLELRLKRLSSLQVRLVEHAATFPSVERIVISNQIGLTLDINLAYLSIGIFYLLNS